MADPGSKYVRCKKSLHVPLGRVEDWERQAAEAGESFSNWIQLMVERALAGPGDVLMQLRAQNQDLQDELTGLRGAASGPGAFEGQGQGSRSRHQGRQPADVGPSLKPWKSEYRLDGVDVRDDLNMVRVETDLWGSAKGGGWLAVEGPVARRPDLVPIIRDPQHVLLRPYEPLLEHGSPDIGFVHYSVGTLHGKDPRILYATSLRHKRKNAPGDIVPMDLTIYPGFSMRTIHQSQQGDAGRIHHVSVRETANGLQVYAHLRGPDGKMRPRLEHRVVPRPELGGLIMLASSYVKDWGALDACGLAATRLSAGIYDARVKAGFYNSYPIVREHPFTDINGPKELQEVQNYLWQGFFLGQRMFEDQDLKDVLSFYGHNVNRRLRSMRGVPEYDGSIRGRLTSIPLDVFGAPGPYRFLHVVAGVLPGGLAYGTGLAAFGEFLPLLSSDVPGKEPLYHEYAMQHYPGYAERRAAHVTT